jgi:hypothetical protein
MQAGMAENEEKNKYKEKWERVRRRKASELEINLEE